MRERTAAVCADLGSAERKGPSSGETRGAARAGLGEGSPAGEKEESAAGRGPVVLSMV